MNAEGAIYLPPTLPEKWLKRLRLTWPGAVAAAGAAMALGLAGACWAQGVTPEQFVEFDIWRAVLQAPILVLYFMIIYPLVLHARAAEVNAFRPLVDMCDADYQHFLSAEQGQDRRKQWLAISLGFVFGVCIRMIGMTQLPRWLDLYALLTSGLMWALIAVAVQASVSSVPLATRLQAHGLRIDLFDLSFVQPSVRMGLLIALAFAGGITISLCFIPLEVLLNIENVVVYAGLVAVIIWVFFRSIRGTHRVISSAKRDELAFVHQMMAGVYRRLRGRAGHAGPDEVQPTVDEMRSWLALEQRILAVPEWPVDLRTLRNLILSILVPIVSVLARVAMERLF